MTARKAGWSQAEAARRERTGRITPSGTRRLAEAILAVLPPDPPEAIEQRRLALEHDLYSPRYNARWRRNKRAQEAEL